MKSIIEYPQRLYSLDESKSTRFIFLIVGISFFGFAWFFSRAPDLWVLTVFFTLLGIAGIWSFIKMFRSVRYNEVEIHYKPFFQRERVIQWDMIFKVDTNLMNTEIKLFDSHRNLLLRFNRHHPNALHFTHMMLDKIPQNLRPSPTTTYQTKGYKLIISTLFFLGLGGIVVLFSMMSENYEFSFFVALLMGVGVFLFFFSTRKLTIAGDKLTLISFKKLREYRISDIIDIEYKLEFQFEVGKLYQIILTDKENKKITIKILGINDIVLFVMLRSWFMMGKAREQRY